MRFPSIQLFRCEKTSIECSSGTPRRAEAGKSSGWLGLTTQQTFDRLRATWLSQRDCAHLIERCLAAPDIRFGIYYGISNNPRQFWDITKARRELGYDPQDSAGDA